MRGWRDGKALAKLRQAAISGHASAPVKSKFSNQRTHVGVETFDSKGEAELAATLDLLILAGEVLYYLRQVPIRLAGGIVYRVDFQVFYADRSVRYLDYKGFETPEFKNKMKLLNERYPFRVECVRKVRGRMVGL